jgi:hypothetical protein
MAPTVTLDRQLLADAHQALRAAVAGALPGSWDRPTPCDQWNVTQMLQHAAGDQLAYAAALTGGPGPAENPFTPSGHLAAAPLAVLDEALAASAAAWSASPLTPDLAEPLLTVAAQIVEPLRGFAYAPALDGPADGDAAALLRYLGRNPEWAG